MLREAGFKDSSCMLCELSASCRTPYYQHLAPTTTHIRGYPAGAAHPHRASVKHLLHLRRYL